MANPKINQMSPRASGSSASCGSFVPPKNLRMALEIYGMLKLYLFAARFYNSEPLIYKNKLVMNSLAIEPYSRKRDI